MTDEPRDDLAGELADVIRLPYANDDAIPSPVDQKRKGGECSHKFTILDNESHKLLCDDGRCQRCGMPLGKERCKCDPSWPRLPGCGIELDPWAWIQRLTSDWRNFSWRYKEARVQVQAVEARVAELKRLERNAKSRIRSRGVTLTMGEARAARDQLRALTRAIVAVLGYDAEAVEQATRVARLHGFKKEDAARALKALSDQVELRENG